MSAVSIIHAPRDEALSEKIAAALARAGHAATRISADPTIGDLNNEGPEDGAAIVVWTKAAAKLARLHEQAREAMARGALIPVAVGGVTPPGGFETLPPVDLSGWTGAMDDPRWRFVLDEIQISQERSKLENGAVWPDAEIETPAPVNEAPPQAERVEQGTPETQYTEQRRPAGPPRARSARHRFKSRHVAIGATVGLVAMTLATAVLAPIVLPAEKSSPQPAAGQQADDTPEPSLDAPAQLNTLQIAQTGTEPDSDAAAEGDELFATPDPLALERFSQDENSLAAESHPSADEITLPVEAQPLDLAAAQPVASETEPGPTADNAAGAAAGEMETAPPDSDAMENLVASLAAEEAGEITPRAPIAPVPEELVETVYLGNYFKECVVCPDMAALPGGSFLMGAPESEPGRRPFEGPSRVVTIDHRFAIGTREVTYEQWQACVDDGACRAYTPPDHGWGRGKQPVVSVSHADAQAYTAWLSNKTGHNYRLPTEAEWEFAARAGASEPFAFGDRITSRRANFNGNYPYLNEKSAYRGRTTPVASFQPNAYGLFDMHGNVWEWTSDCWAGSHAGAPESGAARVTGDCSRRVLKGGAWNTGAWRLRSAHRIAKPVNAREYDTGFRVARDLD